MKKLLFFIGTFVISGTAVSAGCANYEDGSLGSPAPKYRICYDDVCDETELSFECANIYGGQRGYANGWAFYYTSRASGEESTTITWQDREIDEEKHHRLTVQEIGQFNNIVAEPYASADRILMHCTLENGAKKVAVYQSGDIISYAFGADLDRPELSLSSTISDLSGIPFNRVSGSYFEQVRFYNGDTSYEVSTAEFRYGDENDRVRLMEGRIRVKSPGGNETTLTCDDGTVTPDRLHEGIGQIASIAAADGIDLLSSCIDESSEPQSCLGVVKAVDIRDHGCVEGRDWTDCWAHESKVWQSVLEKSETDAIEALTQLGARATALSNAQDLWREGHQLDCDLNNILPFAADGGKARCTAERQAERIGFLRSVIATAEFDG